MGRVLVLYGTVEGHTRSLAERIAEWVRERGGSAILIDTTMALPGLFDESEYDAAIVCGSVHQGRHSDALIHVVRENLSDLNRIPSAFVSVSLSAAIPDDRYQEEAREYVKEFLEETGWRPTRTVTVGGALLYSQYDYMKRLLVRLIARSRGGETDSSRDWVYTDWDSLNGFLRDFLDAADARPESEPRP